MTLTIDFGFSIRLDRRDRRHTWSLPIIRRKMQLTRPGDGRPGPGRLKVMALGLGIAVNSLMWGVL